jgi:hypothetical protein
MNSHLPIAAFAASGTRLVFNNLVLLALDAGS